MRPPGIQASQTRQQTPQHTSCSSSAVICSWAASSCAARVEPESVRQRPTGSARGGVAPPAEATWVTSPAAAAARASASASPSSSAKYGWLKVDCLDREGAALPRPPPCTSSGEGVWSLEGMDGLVLSGVLVHGLPGLAATAAWLLLLSAGDSPAGAVGEPCCQLLAVMPSAHGDGWRTCLGPAESSNDSRVPTTLPGPTPAATAGVAASSSPLASAAASASFSGVTSSSSDSAGEPARELAREEPAREVLLERCSAVPERRCGPAVTRLLLLLLLPPPPKGRPMLLVRRRLPALLCGRPVLEVRCRPLGGRPVLLVRCSLPLPPPPPLLLLLLLLSWNKLRPGPDCVRARPPPPRDLVMA